MDLTQITRIVELMSKHDLTEIDIKSEELALTIKREHKQEEATHTMLAAMPPMPQMMGAPSSPAPGAANQPAAPAASQSETPPPPTDSSDDELLVIESPLVGTFYNSPSPDAEAYVQVGDMVEEDTVVCIIEAMKVMNEIKAERKGVIRKVLVDNGKPVEFGQPLFKVAPV